MCGCRSEKRWLGGAGQVNENDTQQDNPRGATPVQGLDRMCALLTVQHPDQLCPHASYTPHSAKSCCPRNQNSSSCPSRHPNPMWQGPIRGLSVHPSGKLAVSVGRDRLLKLWHLGKGRCSYTARLDVEADDVAFSADGEVREAAGSKKSRRQNSSESGSVWPFVAGTVSNTQHTHTLAHATPSTPPARPVCPAAAPVLLSTTMRVSLCHQAYALLCDKVVSLHAVAAEGGLVAKLTHSRRVTAMLLPTPNVSAAAAAATAAGSDAAAVPLPPPLLLVGLDDGRLCLWDVRRPEAPVWELPGAHKARIRAITAVLQGEVATGQACV